MTHLTPCKINIKECHHIDFPMKEFLPSTKPNQTTMSIIHINIRSLNKPENFEALHEFLTLLPYSLDIVCVSETRLKGNPLINISLPDYNFVHSDSVTNAGGVAVYVSTKYKFKLDCDLEMILNGCKKLWLNIKTNDISNQKFTVGVIYRHPNYSNSTVKEFSEALCNSINKTTNRKDTFYLLEDLNIDLTVNKRSLSSLDFLNSLISCGSLPIITIPTRVTETSATIIDHVTTNESLHEIKPGVIRYNDKLSDHYVIYCNVTNNSVTSPKQTYFTIRDKSTFNANSYRDEMNTAVYDYLSNLGELTELNFDRTFDEFVSLIQNVMEKHAPLKRLSRKQQKLKSKPWITKEIYAMICRKNKMHKSHYILGNEAMKQEYKSYLNKLTKIKALAKKEYYSAEIEKYKTNQRKTWELLRTLLPGNSKKRNILPTTVNVDNVTVTDQQRILNEFNHFSQKSEKISLVNLARMTRQHLNYFYKIE